MSKINNISDDENSDYFEIDNDENMKSSDKQRKSEQCKSDSEQSDSGDDCEQSESNSDNESDSESDSEQSDSDNEQRYSKTIIKKDDNPFRNNDNLIMSNVKESTYLYKISNKYLKKYTKKWEHNRQLIYDKVDDIYKYYKKGDKQCMMSILHFYYDISTQKYICYDGNHRREALVHLAGDDIEINVLCEVMKGEHITQKFIIEKFEIINKQTPIPQLCLEKVRKLANSKRNIEKYNKKIKIIDELIEHYKRKYRLFYKPKTLGIHKPNFNDTTFHNLCSSFEFSNIDELRGELIEKNLINKKQLDKQKIKLTPQQKEKCDKYSFYLFI